MKSIMLQVWFVLFLLPSVAFAQQLDEQTVLKLVSDTDHAISQKDAGGLATFLSDDFTAIDNVNASGQSQKLTLNKSSFIENLKQGWAVATDYKYNRENLKITLSEPTRAVVTATVVETMTVPGLTISGTSTETAVIELVAGNPLITSIVSDTQLQVARQPLK